MSDYELRLLNPTTEHHLFREAYQWRSPKRHVQPDRMPFEEFAKVCDTQLTVALFNGELRAVYHLIEVETSKFEAHFTSRRGTRVPLLLEGARQVAEAVLANGGSEIHAWVTIRNQPLREFLESLQFVEECVSFFPCQIVENETTLPTDERNQRREFVKYVLKADAIGPQRPQTDIDPNRNHD